MARPAVADISLSADATMLRWLRRPGDERQLTDCLGELAQADRRIASGLAEALLQAVELRGHGRGQALFNHLPERLTCVCEDPTTGKPVRRSRLSLRKQRPKDGRIDWVFYPADEKKATCSFELAVEVKIGANLARGQLSKYHTDLAERPNGLRGLMVLAKDMPERDLLDADQHGLWLGVTLWEEVLPLLTRVTPENPALAAQWPLLLDVLKSRDDLGTEQVTWETLARSRSLAPLRRLAAQVKPTLEMAVRKELAKRPSSAGADPNELATIKVRKTTRVVHLSLYVPTGAHDWVGRLALEPTTVGVAMTSTVRPWPRPKGPLRRAERERYDQALGRLTSSSATPPYVAANGDYSRTILLSPSSADVRAVIAGALERELAHIASSGVLDDDL